MNRIISVESGHSFSILAMTLIIAGCGRPTPDNVVPAHAMRVDVLNTGTTASLRGLSVVSDRIVWASGSGGTVLRTTDGGATWNVNTVPGADSLDFRDIQGFSATVAIVMATAGRIYRTADAGTTWQVVYAATDTSVFLDAISFWDAQHGVVMGDPIDGAFLILLTGDAGRSWQPLSRDRSPEALPGEAAFAASGTCLTVWGSRHAWFGTGGGPVARVFRSADRGRSWTAASTPLVADDPSAGVFSVAFEDSLNGLVAGGNYRMPASPLANVASTVNGGRTFTLLEPRPPQYLSVIAGSSTNTLFGAGIAGITFASRAGEAWLKLDSAETNSIAFSRSYLWAVGPEGRVKRINR